MSSLLSLISNKPGLEEGFFENFSDHSPESVFWGLKERWWMQIIDGKYHCYGPMVFDEGLHQSTVEPGYYASIKKACEFASEELTKKITVSFYKELHKRACSHFDGKSTLMSAETAGQFYVGSYCTGLTSDLFPNQNYSQLVEENQDFIYLGRIWKSLDSQGQKECLKRYGLATKYDFYKKCLQSLNWIENFNEQCAKKIEQINSYIAKKSISLGMPHPIARLLMSDDKEFVHIYYQCKVSQIESAVEKLFTQFYQNMEKEESPDNKITHIADLFQMLEWLHSFRDGQGRTDLILLSKSLCEHGVNPPILEIPYVSTFCSLEDWVEYLKKGIKKWQIEFAKINRPAN